MNDKIRCPHCLYSDYDQSVLAQHIEFFHGRHQRLTWEAGL